MQNVHGISFTEDPSGIPLHHTPRRISERQIKARVLPLRRHEHIRKLQRPMQETQTLSNVECDFQLRIALKKLPAALLQIAFLLLLQLVGIEVRLPEELPLSISVCELKTLRLKRFTGLELYAV
jgi:hypothetical protein